MAAGNAGTRRWPRVLLALGAGWLLAAAWGSVVQTQFNLQALVALGVPVPPGLRALTTLQDLAGFAPVYAGILAAGWIPALGLAAWLAR
ncbi:MAG: PQQ-dependent sugar dehydrogenase, partial [Chitinophagaceae bacterium]|nr:PQQ-dependent sugar dehydrogenase [Rubrivivax sp.]